MAKNEKKDWDKVKWTRFERAHFQFPDSELQEARIAYLEEHDIRIYRNSIYQVEIEIVELPPPFGRSFYLSIKTLDKQPRHDWREMQRIKNELVGEEVEAVELYPAESRLVDTANQFHMFCFPKLQFPDKRLPFGYQERLVVEGSSPGVNETGKGSRQRGWDKEDRPADVVSAEALQSLPVGVKIAGNCPADKTPMVLVSGDINMQSKSGKTVVFKRAECMKGKHVCFFGMKADINDAEKTDGEEASGGDQDKCG